MTTATITFHAAHNYGSMLQAYALQHALMQIGVSNEIINLRTPRQREMYKPGRIGGNALKDNMRRAMALPFMKRLKAKYALFEQFLQNDLKMTHEFASIEDIRNARLDYDCYISGGDQIWNTAPSDFDWSYYLPFVERGKRISYAVSMGPKCNEQVTDRDTVRKHLLAYDHISVRENATKRLVESLTGREVEITLDPVLLYSARQWKACYDQAPLIDGDYILVYTPGFEKQVFDTAMAVKRITGLKAVNTIYRPKCLMYSGITNKFDVGPWEFLNLLQHARLIVSGSYHAVILSILYNKKFVAVNGRQDNRMSTILQGTGLLHLSVSPSDDIKAVIDGTIDFAHANDYINTERAKSINFLKNALAD